MLNDRNNCQKFGIRGPENKRKIRYKLLLGPRKHIETIVNNSTVGAAQIRVKSDKCRLQNKIYFHTALPSFRGVMALMYGYPHPP